MSINRPDHAGITKDWNIQEWMERQPEYEHGAERVFEQFADEANVKLGRERDPYARKWESHP